ncbi:MAG: hypothetical protein ACLPKW_25630 [Acetobacteraceae bacterium]
MRRAAKRKTLYDTRRSRRKIAEPDAEIANLAEEVHAGGVGGVVDQQRKALLVAVGIRV